MPSVIGHRTISLSNYIEKHYDNEDEYEVIRNREFSTKHTSNIVGYVATYFMFGVLFGVIFMVLVNISLFDELSIFYSSFVLFSFGILFSLFSLINEKFYVVSSDRICKFHSRLFGEAFNYNSVYAVSQSMHDIPDEIFNDVKFSNVENISDKRNKKILETDEEVFGGYLYKNAYICGEATKRIVVKDDYVKEKVSEKVVANQI